MGGRVMTALGVVADRLTRAADRLETLALGASCGPPPVRWRRDGHRVIWPGDVDPGDAEPAAVVANDCTAAEAEFIAGLDPYAAAALVPALRQAAEELRRNGQPESLYLALVIHNLDTFAARVLREEEETGG